MWYLRRPRFYGQMVREARRELLGGKRDRESAREEALRWCAARAEDTAGALEKLTGSRPGARVEEKFAGVFEEARRAERSCPVVMGGPGDMDLLYWLAQYVEAEAVVETGVAYGWSSLALLLSLRNRPGARLISTDLPYAKGDSERYVGCVVPKELRDQWTILRSADRGALPKALKLAGRLDMCHYDSDKSYEGRSWAYPLLWEALRRGGLFLSDDIDDNDAFREFAERVDCEPVVVRVHDKHVGILAKP